MPQQQGQYQVQTEAQLLKLSPLQLMTTKLLELPIVELEQRVRNEAIDNIALETGRQSDDGETMEAGVENGSSDSDDLDYETEQTSDDLEDRDTGDVSLDDYEESDDELPLFTQTGGVEREERPLGDTGSFFDYLYEQMVDFQLTDHQRELVEYLIGSLSERGYIETPLSRLADEMMFHHNIMTDETELESALAILQQFDPPGIGARDTRECLLLQIDRKMNDREHLLGEKYFLLENARRMIADHYILFVNNNVEKLKAVMRLSSGYMNLILDEVKKLNLYPGLSLNESDKDRVQSPVPDFIIETDENGQINFRLNRGDLPSLRISTSYLEQLKAYESIGRKLSRNEQDFVTYTRSKIDAARLFIEAIRQRQQTLTRTMGAIIQLQHTFFLTQDPHDLQPLILKDVADRAGYDISTVSRVRNSKYCLLDGRIYPLAYFFRHPRSNASGETVDAGRAREAIARLIAAEDKSQPLSDQQLSVLLAKEGINIKRRTVAKYRDEIGIPPLQHRLGI